MGQRLCIADTEVTRARFERVTKSQRAKRCVTAGAATGDNQTIAVDLAAIREIARAVCAVVHVNNSPLRVQPFAILPSITGTAAVVDVEHCKSAAGPVLDRQTQRRRSGR